MKNSIYTMRNPRMKHEDEKT